VDKHQSCMLFLVPAGATAVMMGIVRQNWSWD